MRIHHENGYPNNTIRLEYDLKFTDSLLVKATMTSPTQKDIERISLPLGGFDLDD